MDTILAFIEQYPFITAMPSIAGLFVALGMLLLSERWQVHVLALIVLYFFVGLLHTRVIRPEVALVKALMGWLICLALHVTGRYIDQHRKEGARKAEETVKSVAPRYRWLPPLPPDSPLRSLVLLVTVVLAYAAAVYFPLPQIPRDLGMACYLLAVGGLLLVGMSESSLRVGIGLLVFLSGFDLFYGALEPSLVVTGLLGAGNFLLALAMTFLAISQATVEEKGV